MPQKNDNNKKNNNSNNTPNTTPQMKPGQPTKYDLNTPKMKPGRPLMEGTEVNPNGLNRIDE